MHARAIERNKRGKGGPFSFHKVITWWVLDVGMANKLAITSIYGEWNALAKNFPLWDLHWGYFSNGYAKKSKKPQCSSAYANAQKITKCERWAPTSHKLFASPQGWAWIRLLFIIYLYQAYLTLKIYFDVIFKLKKCSEMYKKFIYNIYSKSLGFSRIGFRLVKRAAWTRPIAALHALMWLVSLPLKTPESTWYFFDTPKTISMPALVWFWRSLWIFWWGRPLQSPLLMTLSQWG